MSITMLRNSLPEKESITNDFFPEVQLEKDWWPVKTFRSQMVIQINRVIEYYYKKAEMFSKAIQKQEKNFAKNISQMESVITLAEDKAKDIKLNDLWQNFNKQDMDILTKKLNDYISTRNGYVYSAAEILKSLLPKDSTTTIQELNDITFGSEIDLSELKDILSKLSSYEKGRPQSGAMSVILGEIYEQLAVIMFKASFEDVLKNFISIDQTGRLKQQSSTKKKNPVSGKADALIYCNDLTFFQKQLTENTKTPILKNSKQIEVQFEADQLIDINKATDYQKFLRGDNQKVLGVSIKSAIKGTVSLGNSGAVFEAISSYLKTIPGEGRFTYYDDAMAYSAYMTSKYLLNVIGASNAIVVAANNTQGFSWTYQWLTNVYQGNRAIGTGMKISKGNIYTPQSPFRPKFIGASNLKKSIK